MDHRRPGRRRLAQRRDDARSGGAGGLFPPRREARPACRATAFAAKRCYVEAILQAVEDRLQALLDNA